MNYLMTKSNNGKTFSENLSPFCPCKCATVQVFTTILFCDNSSTKLYIAYRVIACPIIPQ